MWKKQANCLLPINGENQNGRPRRTTAFCIHADRGRHHHAQLYVKAHAVVGLSARLCCLISCLQNMTRFYIQHVVPIGSIDCADRSTSLSVFIAEQFLQENHLTDLIFLTSQQWFNRPLSPQEIADDESSQCSSTTSHTLTLRGHSFQCQGHRSWKMGSKISAMTGSREP